LFSKLIKSIRGRDLLLSVAGSAILAFGLYNIHALSKVTEGGILGLTLWLEQTLGMSPGLWALILNALCYIFAWRELGQRFMLMSAVSGGSYSLFYLILELFPPVWPGIGEFPLLAAVAGAVFVGVGVGLCIRGGGAPGGDDALAMALSHKLKIGIQWIYLIGDISVLLLSLSYIPLRRMVWSLLTVLLSGQLVALVGGDIKSDRDPENE